jgi:hypothetical protein
VKTIVIALSSSLILASLVLGQPGSGKHAEHSVIPRSWDEAELEAWTIPPREPGVYTVHLPAPFFYSISPHPIYKSYPIYHPAKEPPGYMDWLKQQEPQIVFDPAKLTTESDWIAAGKLVFEAPLGYEPIDRFRSADWYQKLAIPVTADGIVPGRGYVIRKKGVVESAGFACANCHSRVLPDGTLWNGPQTNFPLERDFAWTVRTQRNLEDARKLTYGLFFPSWNRSALADGTFEKSVDEIARMHESIPAGVNTRIGVSILAPPKVADIIGVRDRKYLDLIGRVRHRNIGDLMRYANFQPGEAAFYADRKVIPPEAIPEASSLFRYSDEQAYALAMYIYSLQPPPNPNRFDETAAQGQKVFKREGCALCHTPPLYTSNKLTLAGDFQPPAEHRKKYDIVDIRVGTDPRSAMQPMRGTGYYKVPSIKGVWYRGPFEHNGSVATLEDWFDPRRLRDDYMPTGFVGYGFRTRAVRGHEFGLKSSTEDKKALIAFLKTL